MRQVHLTPLRSPITVADLQSLNPHEDRWKEIRDVMGWPRTTIAKADPALEFTLMDVMERGMTADMAGLAIQCRTAEAKEATWLLAARISATGLHLFDFALYDLGIMLTARSAVDTVTVYESHIVSTVMDALADIAYSDKESHEVMQRAWSPSIEYLLSRDTLEPEEALAWVKDARQGEWLCKWPEGVA